MQREENGSFSSIRSHPDPGEDEERQRLKQHATGSGSGSGNGSQEQGGSARVEMDLAIMDLPESLQRQLGQLRER